VATKNLDKIFKPNSIAIIGASEKEGSVGRILVNNLLELGYKGTVYPVNPTKKEILGKKAYPSIADLPKVVDLAVIATPAKTVPDIVEQCGKKGITGLIIISAGFKEIGPEGKKLENEISAHRKKYNLRIIGPNCLGIIHPWINLNATFTQKMPKPGNIAFISQSGALCTIILDVALHENIGFSHFVSIGSMSDVDYGDLIDYFGKDPHTRSILMYIEGITDARKFMSATRHFARTKPIIVVKAGKYGESAQAAASHTGSLTGEDMIYEAAFQRAGLVRVKEIMDLFNCSEVLGMQPLPKGPNLAIITNAGGPGILATDALIEYGGKLAQLEEKTLKSLNKMLPPYWSHGNPIDILGDAKADRYKGVVKVCLEDRNVDGLLIVYSAQGIADPVKVARDLSDLTKNTHKTILTSFMGYGNVETANKIFNDHNIPTYLTPEQAVETYMYMCQYERHLSLLYETPEELPVENVPPRRPLTVIMKQAAREGREILTEMEAKHLLDYYDIPVVKTLVARTEHEAVRAASQIGYPVVLKILSPDIIHKTDAGGVVLNLSCDDDVRTAFGDIMRQAKKFNPKAVIEGVTVQPMIRGGYEVIIGSKTDSLFGPVVLFGMGGVGVELFKDVSIGLPPLNQTLAKRMMEETKVYRLLRGYRNKPPGNLPLLQEIMVRFSQMLVDFPQIKEVDINPLLLNEKDAFALDARVVIDTTKAIAPPEGHEHLVISPYPKRYETVWKLRDGRTVLLRPIKPEDEPMWLEMFKNFSEESIRYRFFQIIKTTPHETRVRYCNIDYDRELALVAELTEKGQRKILGVVRLIVEPDGKSAEVAFIVADPWQGQGLGPKMLDTMIDICKERKLESIYGIMLVENSRAINLMKKMGFIIDYQGDGTVKGTLDLQEE